MARRETDFAKRGIEFETVQPFVDSYQMITGHHLELLSQRESPDFEALIDGRPTGIELTEIRRTKDGCGYMDEVVRLLSKKSDSYRSRGLFTRPIILVCHSDGPPLFDIEGELKGAGRWDELDLFSFAEVWLMDLSGAYYSAQDWRRPADLFCVVPKELFGLHRVRPEWGRKPFG